MQIWRGQAGTKAAWLILVALLVSSFCISGTGAESPGPLKGVALVIGQSNYEHLTQLANPVSDARHVEGLLADLGFKTDLAADASARKLRRDINGFIEDAEGADVALIYYSGHGIEAGGVNYLVPVDADLSSLVAAEENLVALPRILNELRTRARITIVLLDACRSNPFPKDALVRADATGPGLPIGGIGLSAPKSAVSFEEPSAASESLGEVIGFAAEPGHAALDGAVGDNSPYAAALVKHLTANGGYEFGQVMTMVTEEVYLTTQTRQRPWTNASLRRFLSFGGRVEGGTVDDALIAGERRKLLLTIAATPQQTRAFVETLARDQSLPLDPLYGMLGELQVDTSAGPEELDKQLRTGAENLKNLIAEHIAPIRMDRELVRLAGLADRAQAEGAIGLAKNYRAKASARADELDQTLDKREAEVTADRLELASAYADYAETAILAFDYSTAAQQYAKAHAQAEGRDGTLAFKYKLGQADALGHHGRYKGDNAALRQSIAAYIAALEVAARETDRRSWAVTQNNLGNALQDLGKRESGTATLKRAVMAYEAALTERRRERVPLDWAVTQNNLGNALTALGERESGTATLNRAVAAFEAALGEYSRERTPLDWAKTLNNLGNALRVLGEREGGTAMLTKAVAAYEASLAEYTRERVPLDWATVQNNLGNALQALGQRESGTAMLKRAVIAYEAALTERIRERVPLDWAMTQNNLGNALAIIGTRESGTATLIKAVAAYEAALIEYTRERAPLQWASVQNNLGNAFRVLGTRESGTAALTKAAAAYEAALTVHTRERVPLDWAMTQNNLGNAFTDLGERESGTATLSKAVAAYEAALTEYTREKVPLQWAMAQNNLGGAKLVIGLRTRTRSQIASGKQAVEAARDLAKSAGYDQYDNYFRARLKKFDDALARLAEQ